MTRRGFLGLCGGMAFAAAPRPNFVFILCDDLGWGDLPSFGHRGILAHGGWMVRGDLKMPHVDRLAREGTRFTQYYVASGVCSPSRAAIMTGQFPARLGIHDYLADPELNARRGVLDSLDTRVPTLTRTLQAAGYATAHFGKWHLSSGPKAPKPEEYGIDRYDPCMRGQGGRVHSSGTIADQTIAFMEANRERPFFVNAWMYDPHSPLHPTDEMMAQYKDLGTGWKGHPSAFEVYFGMLSYLDTQVGRILEALDRMGLSENTVVIFTSDNGPETGLIPFVSHYGMASTAGPFRGVKRSLYEGGIRTPFLVRWPGKVPAARVDNDTVLAGVDMLPTLSKVAGVSVPGDARPDGEDMSEALMGRGRPRTKALLWENRYPVYGHVLDQSPMLAIREGNWKLLLNPDRSRVELYDVPHDPSEMNNLAERNAAVTKKLSAKVIEWQRTLPRGPIDPGAGKNDYAWPK